MGGVVSSDASSFGEYLAAILTLADPRLKLHGFADNLFLLSRALHSALLINHVAQVWYGDDTYSFSKRDLIIVNFVS